MGKIKSMKHIILSICLLCVGNIVLGQKIQELDSFHSIKANGKFELRIVASEKPSVTIKSEQVDFSQVICVVSEKQLVIKTGNGFPKGTKVMIEVACSELQKVELGNGVNAYNRDTLFAEKLTLISKSGSELDMVVNSDTIYAKVNKGGFMRLSGDASHVQLRTSSKGDYRATTLNVNSMTANLSGGSAEVKVKEMLDVKANMKGRLDFVAQPAKIEKKESLGGRVGKLEEF